MNKQVERILYKIFLPFLKDFDDVSSINQGDTQIDYGYVHGNNTIVFIKAGFHGTCYGYKSKYLKIARNLNKKHGCTVIAASNPTGMKDDFEGEMQMLKFYAQQHGWSDYQVGNINHPRRRPRLHERDGSVHGAARDVAV